LINETHRVNPYCRGGILGRRFEPVRRSRLRSRADVDVYFRLLRGSVIAFSSLSFDRDLTAPLAQSMHVE